MKDKSVFESYDESDWPENIPRDRYEVTATDGTGSYSGRTLFKVACKACDEVLTEATTAPDQIAKYHEMDIKHA